MAPNDAQAQNDDNETLGDEHAVVQVPRVPTQTKSGDPGVPLGDGVYSAGRGTKPRTSEGQRRQPDEGKPQEDSQAVSFQGDSAFAILRPLAAGGLGEVLVARDAALNREVAVKRIHARLDDDLQSRARFLLEAEITAGLEHPSIVPIYALGTSRDGRPFYAMRLIQGETLEEAIHCFHRQGGLREDPVGFRQLLGHLISVCHAVAYAHSRGVLHRDLKPANILLGKFGETLLVDWGLAKLLDQPDAPERTAQESDQLQPTSSSSVAPTLVGSAVGTPRYMSPEQALGRSEAIGPAADVYGLGATLYCLLTGRAPLSEMTEVGSVLQAVAAGDIPAPRTLSRKVPRTLDAICRKAMALRPENRYPTASALAKDLDHWLAGEPVQGVHEGIGPRLTRWEQRNRILIRIGGLALLTLAVVAGTAAMLVNLAREQADQRRREAEEQRLSADSERAAAQTLAARLAIDRGLRLCEENVGHEGLLWMIRGLELAARDEPFQNVARRNLAGWLPAQHQLRAVLKHDGPVLTVAVSPEGRWILTASEDGTARLWDCVTGKPRGPALRHGAAVRRAAFSPDGGRILTASDDGTARFWEMETGRPWGLSLRHEAAVVSACWSEDGRLVATGSEDRTARLWDAGTGEPRSEPLRHKGTVTHVAFTRDGRRLITATHGVVHAWETETGASVFAEPLLGPIRALALAPDGQTFAVAAGGPSAQLRELATGKLRGESFAIHETILALHFMADGRLVSGSFDTLVRLWDPETRAAIGGPVEHQGPVQTLAVRADGTQLASGGGDNTARVWNTDSLAAAGAPLAHPAAVSCLAFLPNRHSLVTGCLDGAARIWDLASDSAPTAPLLLPAPPRAPLVFRPDGKVLAACSADGTFCLYDVERGHLRVQSRRHDQAVLVLTITPDGRSFVTAGDDGRIHVWDSDTGQLRFESPPVPPLDAQGPVRKAVVSPDSHWLVTATMNEKLQIWDLATGQSSGGPWTLEARASSVAFSHDGRTLVLGLANGEILLWDPVAGRPLGPSARHTDVIRDLVLSPDGRILASASTDNTARLWRAGTLEPLGPPMRHPGYVWMVRFSPDGLTLLTAGFDGTARLWDAATSQPRGEPLRHEDMVQTAIFSPDGRTVASAGRDRTARLWDANTGFQIGPSLLHGQSVSSIAFRPGQPVLASAGPDRAVRFWRVPQVATGTPLELRQRVQRLTGLELEPDSSLRPLSADAWLRLEPTSAPSP